MIVKSWFDSLYSEEINYEPYNDLRKAQAILNLSPFSSPSDLLKINYVTTVTDLEKRKKILEAWYTIRKMEIDYVQETFLKRLTNARITGAIDWATYSKINFEIASLGPHNPFEQMRNSAFANSLILATSSKFRH